jgi:hypothetical protein
MREAMYDLLLPEFIEGFSKTQIKCAEKYPTLT